MELSWSEAEEKQKLVEQTPLVRSRSFLFFNLPRSRTLREMVYTERVGGQRFLFFLLLLFLFFLMFFNLNFINLTINFLFPKLIFLKF
jgi:hypothetical protein